MTATGLAQNIDFLKTLAADESANIQGVNAFEFSVALLANLGSSDPVLRDELSYTILERFIASNRLSVSQQESILSIVIDHDHLFHKVGEMATDSVFMRSFSALIVAAVLEADSHDPKLSRQSVHTAVNAVLSYVSQERDHRGFVNHTGWAHSVAHTADALNSCMKHPYTTAEERVSMMDALRNLATMAEPLCFQEDNRLAFAALTAIGGGLISHDYAISWIQSFRHTCSIEKEEMLRHSNTEHFFGPLYCSIVQRMVPLKMQEKVTSSVSPLTGLGQPVGDWVSGSAFVFTGLEGLLLASGVATVAVGVVAFSVPGLRQFDRHLSEVSSSSG